MINSATLGALICVATMTTVVQAQNVYPHYTGNAGSYFAESKPANVPLEVRKVERPNAEGVGFGKFLSNDQLVTADTGNSLSLWDVKTGNRLEQMETSREIQNLALSPDEKLLAVWDEGRTDQPSDSSVRLYYCRGENHFGHDAGVLGGPPGLINEVKFSSDGRYVLLEGHYDDDKWPDDRIFDLKTFREIDLAGNKKLLAKLKNPPDKSRYIDSKHDQATTSFLDKRTSKVICKVRTVPEAGTVQGPAGFPLLEMDYRWYGVHDISPDGRYVLIDTFIVDLKQCLVRPLYLVRDSKSPLYEVER